MRGLTLGPNIRTVLVIGAHSDDIEIGAGGLIRWLLQTHAARLHWTVLSASGSRETEARASALSILGDGPEHSIELLDFRDGFFPYDGARVKEYFERLRKTCEPDLILTHFRYDLHQDHRLTSELTWNTFRDHLILEYEIPKYDGDLSAPNVFVPLTSDIVDAKVAGLIEHFGSQRSKGWFSPDTFRGLMRLRGIECRAPSGYAEGFHCRKAVLVG